MKKKSNWKWWLLVLGFIAPFITANYPPGPTIEDIGDAIFGGILWFIIGFIIDKIRESIWKNKEKKSQLESDNKFHATKQPLRKAQWQPSTIEKQDNKPQTTDLENGDYIVRDGKLYRRVDEEFTE